MEKERFTEIMKEYDFTDHEIDLLWSTRPLDLEINEEGVRFAATQTASIKHLFDKD